MNWNDCKESFGLGLGRRTPKSDIEIINDRLAKIEERLDNLEKYDDAYRAIKGCKDCIIVNDGDGGFLCPKHHNLQDNIKVTERHAVMRTAVGKIHVIKYLLTDDEVKEITYTSQLLKYLKEKIAIYGDPVVKELTFKDGEIVITGDRG